MTQPTIDLTEQQISAEREAFEAKSMMEGMSFDRSIQSGNYLWVPVEIAWQSWLARAEQSHAELEQVGWYLNTGHGVAMRPDKPDCMIDRWKKLYARKGGSDGTS